MSPLPGQVQRRGPLNLLIAEPDENFMLRLQISLRSVSTSSALYHVKSEQDMFQFLRKAGAWENAQQPDVIFLDATLITALDRLKSGGPYSGIPVIVMSAEPTKAQARDSYQRFANGYIPKPQDQPGMRGLAAAIDAFWFKTAKLPPNKDS